MDTMRSETRRRQREEAAAGFEGESDAGLAHVEEVDTRDAVRRELEKLPADQREVLVLRLVAERSYKEIAEITGKKIGTVGWLISVGLQELGARLGPIVAADAARSAATATSVSSGTTRGGAR
jgi:RNA polymerase sigma-70 factor (ECF subfamily)